MLTHEQRTHFVKTYGNDPIAYSTLQTGMRYFETQQGFIAYQQVGAIQIALGTPICAVDDRATLIAAFLAQNKKTIFCYLRKDLLPMLKEHHLYHAGMGVDRFVDHVGLSNTSNKKMRSAVKKAKKAHLQLVPFCPSQITQADKAQLHRIQQRYLQASQYANELRFINCPFELKADGMKRYYTIEKYDREHQGIFGFVVMNPFYQKGVVSGYLLDIIRFEKTKLWGVWLSVVHHLSQQLKAENLQMSLGFCPLHHIQPPTLGERSILNLQVNLIATLLKEARYVKQLQTMKSVVYGIEEPRYFASYSRNTLTVLTSFLTASGVHLPSFFSADLAKVMLSSVQQSLKSRRR